MLEDMSKLNEVYEESKGSESYFPHKSVLFIGSESYDAPTITVIEGLSKLGFNLYTIDKPNINSWFCNQVVSDPSTLSFDFVLSNLHWGTRWSYYDQYDLNSLPKVLIDGDDNKQGGLTWRDRHALYCERYEVNPPEEVKKSQLSPYRWMEPLGDYQPNVIFTSQKEHGDNETYYLPFGLIDKFLHFFENRPFGERDIDFLHIPGGGVRRERMRICLARLKRYRLLPGKLVNETIWGGKLIDDRILDLEANDDNVHSYHRWVVYNGYSEALSRSKILIYPGIHDSPQWDSKRPWEGYAAGCLVMMLKPTIDVSEYPITEICPFAVCESVTRLIAKCAYLKYRPNLLNRLRQKTYSRAKQFFNSRAIASYFLSRVKENVL